MSYNLVPINHFGRVKDPCGDCDGDVCTMNCSPREVVPESRNQQLVARIKRSSKYYYQTDPPGAWFDVRVVSDTHYQLRGNSNNYRFSDVVMGLRIEDGRIVDFKTGKTSK